VLYFAAELHNQEEAAMLIFLAIAAGIILVLRFMPIRRQTLIEGVFNHSEPAFGWYGGNGIAYFFDH